MRAKSTKGNGAGAKRKRACYAQDAVGIKEGGGSSVSALIIPDHLSGMPDPGD